jgi:dihydrolipoamide dehydrogenase
MEVRQMRDEHLTIMEWMTVIDDLTNSPREVALRSIAPPEEDDREFDAIFIGGGAAGRFGSAYLRAMGGRQLVIDKWPFLGGSCPHEACVPHHLFSEAAREMDLARWFSGKLWFPEWDDKHASIQEMIGVQVGRTGAGRSGFHAVMNWQSKEQLSMEYILNAPATIIDAHTVEAAGELFTTKNLVLCTGARTVFPDIPGIDRKGVYDFSSLLDHMDYEPNRCVIIGGSKVAIEYGSFFQATGCPTTILTRSPLMCTANLHHVDEGLRRFVVDNMRLRGVEILEGFEPVEIHGNHKVEAITYRKMFTDETYTIETDFVFVATGERPNLKPYGELGLDVDDNGFIVVNPRMQTSVPNVYATGDLIGPPMEMFKARKSAMVAARNIMGEPSEWDYSEYPDFLHSTYEVTWCGLTEDEAREKYGEVVKIQMPPDPEIVDPKTFILPCAEGSMLYAFHYPELTGWFKLVIAAESRKIVGAHHVGYGAKDAFQYLDYLIRRPEGFTIDEMAQLNELFLNPEHFIQLSRLRAGQKTLVDL